MFVVLEGIDGCGKSTQAKLLGDWLKKEGHEVFMTAEPSKNRIGRFLRDVLSGAEKLDPKTVALLFTADRYEHLANEIQPALDEHKIVVCERYYHSTIAYQSAQGVSRKWLLELNSFVVEPDVTVLLDVKPSVGVSRTKTKEIFENEEFLDRVRDNYLKMDDGFVKLNGERPAEEVFREIQDRITKAWL